MCEEVLLLAGTSYFLYDFESALMLCLQPLRTEDAAAACPLKARCDGLGRSSSAT